MMRVQVNESPRECTLKVEGEIAGIAVDELARFWRDLTCSCSATVVIDVRDVIRIDRKARELLRSMHQDGVRFIGARLAIQDILDEVTGDGNFGD